MEAQALDRSKLEQKDRAELAAIVDAMGGKATSRAKKADLVDQIMRLAGVDTDATPDAAPEGAPAAVRPAADAPAASDVADPVGAGDAGDAGPSLPEPEVIVPDGAVGSEEEPLAEWELAFDDGDAAPAARSSDGRREQNRGGQGNRGGGQGGQAQQGGSPGQGHGAQGQQGDGDSEPGNRRRRRRGRDRGRDREGQLEPTPSGGGAPDDFAGEPVEVEGFLDLRDEGYGFLRVHGYRPSKDDVYVSVKQVRQLALRKGDHLTGASRPASRNEKNPALLRIDTVNGRDPEAARGRRRFDELTPQFPDSKLTMEIAGEPESTTSRIIDLLSPIGKGQRGLVIAPPKSGATTVLQQIARSIEANHPDVHLIVLLVDERPEEVAGYQTAVHHGEVAASTFDRPPEEHTQVAELTIERAKRMVEEGLDVVIVADGITRLARAYNLSAPPTGRALSGGIDAAAIHPTKRFFGAARSCVEGGSLTIVATALVETGSRSDELIFDELVGAATMELRLDGRLAERRIYPAVDGLASSTSHEDRLLDASALEVSRQLRGALADVDPVEGSPLAAFELLRSAVER